MINNSKILIVDDEPRICSGLKTQLCTQNYEVQTCNSGNEALNYLVKDDFDLILLDVFMEGMDGFQVIENIINQKIDTPVIIMTGNASTESAVKALRMGASDYLKKPFETEDLYKSVRNILNRRALEKELKESDKKYEDLMNIIPQGIQITDLDGKITFSNPAHHKIQGIPKSGLIGKYIWELIAKEEDKIKIEEYYNFLIKEQPKPELHFTVDKTKDGRIIYTQINWDYIRDSKGKVTGIISVINDITERKRVEKELFFKENIIKSSSCAISTCDLERNMTYGNPFFQKLWGFASSGEFLGKPFQNFWLLGNQDEDIMRALQSEGTWMGELKGMRKDGSLFDVQVSAATVFDDSGKPIALTSTSIDITERKETETKLQQLQKIESLGRMAGAIAHNFNNQFQIVIGSLEITMASLPQALEPNKNIVMAIKAVRQAAKVSRQMLTYLGQTSDKHEPIDLSGACRQSLSLLKVVIPKGIILNVDFPGSGPVIRATEGHINQVLANLVTNAWESISNNQGTISLAVSTVTQENIPTLKRFPMDWTPQPVHHVCLEVSDTGCGITSIDIEKLFDPFFTTKFTGRGMGLSVVMGIMKTHGGCITVDSEVGSGSVFRIYLPAFRVKEPDFQKSEEKPTVIEPTKQPAIGTGKILLMDDEEAIRIFMGQVLTRLGYDVETCIEGKEAVEIYTKAMESKEPFDVVILDLTNKIGMGGQAAMKRLFEIDPYVKGIIVTGYSDHPVVANFRAYGFSGFVIKPTTRDELNKVINKVLS